MATTKKKKAPAKKPDHLYIKYMPLSEVRAAPRNAKDHDIGAIIVSYREFGFVTPGVVNEKTGTLVAGHGRAEALLEMKLSGEGPPKRIRVRKADKEWMVPFIRGIEFDSDAQAEAFIIADNKLGELGGWNWAMLPDMLEAARDNDLLTPTGFDEDELESIMKRTRPPDEFPDSDPSDPTSHQCPRCGYEWN
jgi:ParB-like chromosome segregation protein Spo0J